MAEVEQFKLPDGTLVSTGNLVPDELPRAYAEFPQAQLLDPSEAERLIKKRDYKKVRTKFAPWMINQSSVGKCNTSAAAGAFYRVRDITGQKHVALADNYMYYHINGGQDRGSMLDDGMAFLKDQGFAPRVLPSGEIGHLVYNERQVPDAIKREADAAAHRFKGWEPYRVPEDYEGFKQTIVTAIAREYPIVMAWHVGNSSMRLQNGYAVQGRGPGNHASFFHAGKWVGGKDLVHPDLCNSWGPSKDAMYGPQGSGWGEGGFGLMTMESAFQCRKYHDFYVITGAVEDPENSNL